MIEHLIIRDFQKHEKLILDLDHHVTCLTGKTDSGKSSILRALRWVCMNQPVGKEFIRHGAERVKVKLIVDGKTIIRERSKNTNLYRLDGQELAAFGADVPEPISQLLNVGPVNFQGQFDPPFWFSLSPGQVSKELNAIIDLGVIDGTLGNVAAELRKAKLAVEISKERLTEAKIKKDRLSWIEELNEDLRVVEGLCKQRLETSQKRKRLCGLHDDADKAEESVKRGKQSSQEFEALRQKREALESRSSQVRDLWELVCNSQVKERLTWAAKRGLKKAERGLSRIKACPICGNQISRTG